MKGSAPLLLQPAGAGEESYKSVGLGESQVESSFQDGESKVQPLLFPTLVDLDPPSPDPLRPSSPLRWRALAPLSPQILHETPVRGLLTRDPTFSEHRDTDTGASFADEATLLAEKNISSSSDAGRRVLEKRLLDLDSFGEQSINEFLDAISPACVASNQEKLDYSIALEYCGPPITHSVPKVEPLVCPRSSGSDEKDSTSKVIPVAPPVDPKCFGNELTEQSVVESEPMVLSEEAGPMLSAKVSSGDLTGFLSPYHSISAGRQTGEKAVSAHEVKGSAFSRSLSGKDESKERGDVKLGAPPSDGATKPAVPVTATAAHPVIFVNSPRVFPAPVEVSASKSPASVSRDSSVVDREGLESASARASTSASASVSACVSASEYRSPAWKLPAELTNVDHYAPAISTDGALSVGSVRLSSYRGRSMSLPSVTASSHHSKTNSMASMASEFSQQLYFIPGEEDCSFVRGHRRRGVCHRCSKRHLWSDREACLVCGAKYCSNCVLVAMGSMPEGRKCTHCIGKPIHETRRHHLGKCSRLLKSLLSSLEIQQILKAERECASNQLQPQQLVVNTKPLTAEEMSDLLSCCKPPSKLKPGRFWYDSQSGLWGKEGEHPHQIISSGLKVGGRLQRNASNGNTGVTMNERELGKMELRLYRLAGVHCPSGTNLWVDDDGSYSEVGQKGSKGSIWETTSAKWLYPFFSLPIPRVKSTRSTKVDTEDFLNKYLTEYLEPKRVQKLLLLGHEGSGRSTVFKQAKYLFKDGFSPEELQAYKSLIQSNAYKYISILLEGRERFEDADRSEDASPDAVETGSSMRAGEGSQSPYALDLRLKPRADWFLEIMATGCLQTFFPAATREYAPVVEALWHDPAIQATFKRKDELHMLPDVAGYFLEKVAEVSSNEYEPSEDDILAVEGLTQGSGLAEIEFIMEDKAPLSGPYTDPGDSSTPVGRYQLIRVGGVGITDGRKWLEMFEDVCAVIFCVALSDYDQMWADSNGALRNKMIQSKELFECILQHPSFRDTPFVLLLNKRDVFEEKICKGIPLSSCDWLSDFQPVKSSNPSPQSVAEQAYHYVVRKFKDIYTTMSNARGITGRKMMTFELNALDRSKVNNAFMYIREILKWEADTKAGWNADYSYCTDTSSFSPSLSANHPAVYNLANGGVYHGVANWTGRTV